MDGNSTNATNEVVTPVEATPAAPAPAPEAAPAPAAAPQAAPAPAAAPQAAPAPAAAPQAAPAPDAAPKKELTPEEKKKKTTKIIVGVAIGVGVAIVGIILLSLLISILTVFKKPKVNLNKYVTVSYDGYEGRGRATAVIDYNQLRSDYRNKIKIKRKYADAIRPNYFGYASATDAEVGMEYFLDSIHVSVEPGSGLTTGDSVQVTFDIDDATLTEYCKVKVKHKDFSSKAEGFKQAALFDPFEFITLSYSGIAPNGYVNIAKDFSNEMVDYINYEVSKNSELRNGDKIIVKAKIGNEDSFADRFGALPNQDEKEYTVEGLPAYIQSASEIPDETIQKITAQANDTIRSKYKREGSNYSAGYEVESVQYVGNYFLKPKAGSGNNGNAVFFVFKVNYNAHYREENAQVSTYVVFRYNDIKNLPDEGVYVNVMEYQLLADSYLVEGVFNNENFYVYGYGSIDQVFDKFVVSNMEKYEYEKNITE